MSPSFYCAGSVQHTFASKRLLVYLSETGPNNVKCYSPTPKYSYHTGHASIPESDSSRSQLGSSQGQTAKLTDISSASPEFSLAFSASGRRCRYSEKNTRRIRDQRRIVGRSRALASS